MKQNLNVRIVLLLAILIFSCIHAFEVRAEWHITENDTYRYNTSDGKPVVSQWLDSGDMKYYFDDKGDLLTDTWLQEDGHSYYLNSSGEMVVGLYPIDGKIARFDYDGKFISYLDENSSINATQLETAAYHCYDYADYAEYALDKINEMRSEFGIKELELDYNLSIAATYRGVEMHEYDYFSHIHNEDVRAITISKYLAPGYHVISENIYSISSTKTLGAVHEMIDIGSQDYKESQAHYKNIINTKAKRVGIGLYRIDEHTQYYVMIFSDN